jgi:cytidylate kinase-like protein/ankyrin repeat protein
MAIWTISAQPGTPGPAVAAELAARADVPLLDRHALVELAHELEPRLPLDDDLEARVCGRLNAFALSLATGTGSIDAARELELRRALPELGRTIVHEVSRHPAVVLAAGAFACLRDHPAAVHVRLQAQREWRAVGGGGRCLILPGVTDEFIVAACVPCAAHSSGTLDEADAILAAHPEVAAASIYAAAILGDAAGTRRLLSAGPSDATAVGGPYGWDALTYMCFSRYLRLRGSDAFVDAAQALLEAGADPNTGFFDAAHEPEPTFESALYGAAGVAHHAGLTRLLLARGADPNAGGEVAYHAPEGFEDEAMQAVVESGRLADDGLTTMLHRKLDWSDLRGVRWLLARAADPNAVSAWGDRALHHALARKSSAELLEALLDSGADPSLPAPGREGLSAVVLAERAGRTDALDLFRRRGHAVEPGRHA